MNRLVKEIVNSILQEDARKVTAIYGGGFKPPIKGHFNIVKTALKDMPEIDKFLVYVGGGVRDGIEQEQAIQIWDVYKEILGSKVEIEPSVAPIGDIMRYAKEHPTEEVYFVIGYREGREDDLKDIASRTKGVEEKYPNLKVKVIKTSDPEVSGTNARKALQKGDKDTFLTFLPDEVPANEKEEIYNIVTKTVVRENVTPSNTIDIIEKCAELTNYMREKGYNVDPVPALKIVDNDVENAEDFLGRTAYYNPGKKMIVLYTYGRHPKDIVRSFSHEMIHHIQNLEGRIGNGDIKTTNTNEDDYLKQIEAEANLLGTMTFRNWTDGLQENKQLTEGRYDKLANELSSFAFGLMKDGHDVGRKVIDELFVVGPADEEVDFVSDEFEFDFVVQAKYTDDTYTVDGGANAGWDKKGKPIQPLLTVRFEIPKNPDWQRVSFDLKDVVRHELEHLTQDGENVKGGTQSDDPRLVRPSKQMADDQFLRDMIDANLLPKAEYFKLEKEVDAMLQGLYFKAKKSKKPFIEVIDDYLDKQPITSEERKEILDLWAKRTKNIGLPMFEEQEKKPKKYYIFSDMDGVLADFDKGYKQLTGVTTQHANSQGKDEFWKLFRDSLIKKNIPERSYWANLKPMSDKEKLWNFISPFNPYVLTAPSVDFNLPFEERYNLEKNQSMQGKTEWADKYLPNMRKLYFASAKNKSKLAGPNKILIDDREDTIRNWEANGGIGILHTSAASTIDALNKIDPTIFKLSL